MDPTLETLNELKVKSQSRQDDLDKRYRPVANNIFNSGVNRQKKGILTSFAQAFLGKFRAEINVDKFKHFINKLSLNTFVTKFVTRVAPIRPQASAENEEDPYTYIETSSSFSYTDNPLKHTPITTSSITPDQIKTASNRKFYETGAPEVLKAIFNDYNTLYSNDEIRNFSSDLFV